MKKITSFRAIAKGKEVELFYVVESPNSGDLTLVPRHARFYSEDPTIITGDPTLHNKFQIHTTPSSATGSTIHRTIISRDKRRDTYIWTDAIKKKIGFAPLFWKLCCDMGFNFEPKPHNEIVRVCEYDTSYNILYYSILVSAPEVQFRNHQTVHLARSNVRNLLYCFDEVPRFFTIDRAFRRFRITLMGSFLGFPSIPYEHLKHHITVREDEPGITPELAKQMSVITKAIPETILTFVYEHRRRWLIDRLLEGVPQFSAAERKDIRNNFRWRPLAYPHAPIPIRPLMSPMPRRAAR